MKIESFNKAIDNIYDIVGESVMQNIPTLDHIMGVKEMSQTDKVWYEAYKKYGNRNHTWQDFRDMFYGDIETMKKTVSHWKTWAEINNKYFKTNNQLRLVADMVKKYGLKIQKDSDIELYKDEYPDLFDAYKKLKSMKDSAYGNYSTFNPGYAKLEREFEKKSNAIPKDDKKAKIDLVSEYLLKMDEYIDLKNGNFVIGERIEMYRDIILNNPKILMLAHNFDNLSGKEKIDLARMILNESAKHTGTLTSKIIQDDAPEGPHILTETQGGGYQRGSSRFLFKSNISNFSNLPSFLLTLSHEDAHRIDYMNENYGMIGEQLMRFVTKNYMSNAEIADALYRKFATEQSSYYIGRPTGAALEYIINHQKEQN